MQMIQIPGQFYGACLLRLLPVPSAVDYDSTRDLLTVSSDDPDLDAFFKRAERAADDSVFANLAHLGVLRSAFDTAIAIKQARETSVAGHDISREQSPRCWNCGGIISQADKDELRAQLRAHGCREDEAQAMLCGACQDERDACNAWCNACEGDFPPV